jgi:hypothetical protein
MSGSSRTLRLVLQGLGLGLLAWASLRLSLLVAEVRFFTRLGSPPSGSLTRVIALVLAVGAGLWLYGRSDRLAAVVWHAARRRRTS